MNAHTACRLSQVHCQGLGQMGAAAPVNAVPLTGSEDILYCLLCT